MHIRGSNEVPIGTQDPARSPARLTLNVFAPTLQHDKASVLGGVDKHAASLIDEIHNKHFSEFQQTATKRREFWTT